MASASGGSDEAALLARIRALSGAIEQHKTEGSGNRAASSSYGYSNGRGRGSSYYAPRARGRGAQRGSYGRGYSHGPGASSAGPHASRHRSLVLTGPGAAASTSKDGAQTSSGDATPSNEQKAPPAEDKDGWVKRKSTHNMSLVSSSTFQKTEPARIAAIAATQSAKQAAKGKAAAIQRPVKGNRSASLRRGDNLGEVIIDGVTFEFDETGTKLVKKQMDAQAEQSSSAGIEAEAEISKSPTSTPLKTSVNGQNFIRTKTGNLISQDILDRRKENKLNATKLKRMEAIGKEIAERQKMRNASRAASKRAKIEARGLCAFFNKTGQCKNGISCPFRHDPTKLAVCPRALRPGGCTLPAGTCPLSHTLRPERVPHCVHYLATNDKCRNGDQCIYTHPSAEVAAQLTNESPVCMEFSNFGWCGRGAACPMRHTWDCPDFLRKGKCERRGCKLMHVVRISNVEQERQESENRALRDDDLFVRDDDAAHPHSDDDSDEDDGAAPAVTDAQNAKRKRALLQEPAEADADEALTDELAFVPLKGQSRVFTGQNDFISFDDVEGDVDEEEDADEGEEVEEAAASSVHSDSSAEEESDEEE